MIGKLGYVIVPVVGHVVQVVGHVVQVVGHVVQVVGHVVQVVGHVVQLVGHVVQVVGHGTGGRKYLQELGELDHPVEASLRRFDLDHRFGPCRGIGRTARFARGAGLDIRDYDELFTSPVANDRCVWDQVMKGGM
ncbi:hypothetical protein GNI_001550 [Gregarina niphandrodes]|uniref:Uncharacterized protein n=1 Tax=Gregarina niphandrodes TaxID=110365 RepID=A0A023BDU8_GRENI|nr:hypothetical protein GNI_001550 [Gregarina niphandrodes]EZG89641.1 hypothetical protein GNI_001550 [Gregarina niphandrodes]|eukprot:XP_011128475.1 hypothetical protein GNI_001550 [Gregarina niphandrodes]